MKYLLDTDIFSQYTKRPPNPRVDAWLQRTDDSDLYVSSFTVAELWYGIGLLPPGRRRTDLENWVENEVATQFYGRTVIFDLNTARYYGSLMARAKKNGHNPNVMDALIAATAAANGMTLATLNRKDFEKLGVKLVEL